VEDVVEELHEAEDELLGIQDDIVDVFDVFDQRIKAINDSVIKKAVTSGMPKEYINKFQEFDVRNMYVN